MQGVQRSPGVVHRMHPPAHERWRHAEIAMPDMLAGAERRVSGAVIADRRTRAPEFSLEPQSMRGEGYAI